MDTKYKVIICVTTLVVTFAVGRYSKPDTVRIETKTVEVEKKVDKTKTDIVQHKKKTTVVVVKTKPDGEKESTKTIVETDDNQDKTVKSDVTNDTTTTDLTKKVSSDSKVSINALVGVNINQKDPLYGLSVSKPVLGPISIGIWGLNNTSCGLSVGVVF